MISEKTIIRRTKKLIDDYQTPLWKLGKVLGAKSGGNHEQITQIKYANRFLCGDMSIKVRHINALAKFYKVSEDFILGIKE